MLLTELNCEASAKGPDFAFPEKVEKSASASLKSALKKGNSQEIVESLIQLGVARTLINTDSLPSVIRRVGEVEAAEQDVATKSLLNLLMSEMYTQAYRANRYVYDARETTTTAGNDYRLWSKRQFAEKVALLVRESMANPEVLRAIKIQDYQDIISLPESDRIFYPTLLDFIGTVGIRNLAVFSSSAQNVLSINLLNNPLDESLYPGESAFPCAEILKIYKLLVDVNADNPAPYFMQYLGMEQFIAGKLFYDDSQDATSNSNLKNSAVISPLNRRLMALYDKYSDNEFSAIFLTEISLRDASNRWTKEYYNRLVNYRNRFPSSRFIPNVENQINYISQSQASISMPSTVGMNRPVEVSVNCENARNVVLEIFDVTSKISLNKTDSYINADLISGLNPLDTKGVEFSNAIPFGATQKLQLVFPKYGLYVIRMTVDGERETGRLRLIRCSDLSAGVSSDIQSVTGWVVDGVTGFPIEGASLRFTPWSRRTTNAATFGPTDADGSILLKLKENGKVIPIKGDDKYGEDVSVYGPISSKNSQVLVVQIFTSLGLYRPGDVVDFSVVAYNQSDTSRVLAANQPVTLELRDANYTSIDTLNVKTDVWGRAEGSFELPSTGLTGQFTICVTDMRNAQGWKSFMVSDYKLPDFEVKTTEILPPASSSAPAIIKGIARAYSGFPISGATVKANLKVMAGYWWRRFESEVFYTVETQTDETGNFTVEIPPQAITSSPAPNGVFVCEMTITAENGESHELTARFNMGKPLEINVSVPAEINLDSEFAATVSTVDLLGEEKPIELNYEILRDSAVVAQGTIMPGSLVDVIKGLSTGSYQLIISPVDSQMANPASAVEFIAYTSDAKECPVNQHLWMLDQSVRADANGNAEVILGSNAEDTKVLRFISVFPGKVVDHQWITLHKGMQKMTIQLPEGANRCKVHFLSVRDFESTNYSIDVEPYLPASTIELVETFRDRVTPGNREEVRITVKPHGTASAESAVILDMSNKAIEALYPNSLGISKFTLPGIQMPFNGFQFGSMRSSVYVPYRDIAEYQMVSPEFNLYGYSFTQRPYYMGKLSVRKSRASMDSFDEDVSINRLEMAVAPAAMMAKGVDSETISEDAMDMADNGAGLSTGPQNVDDQADNYRPSEIPLAFFKPMLTTDEGGSLAFSYEVPNANTTWVLRGLAYNKGLQTAAFSSEVVASKPVMVSINVPRFLRNADRVVLPATVMNNSESTLQLDILLEVLSGTTNKVIASDIQQITLSAGMSSSYTLPLDSVNAEPNLIFRVKATGTAVCESDSIPTSTRYSDGEQVVIPVLPSEQDVTESEIFYLAPNQSQFTLQLPELKGDDRAYLNFTENPAWEVVSALPGLRDNKINSSLEAMASLFSACVAEGIIKDNPEIARVLRKWAESGDSALVSNLEKNTELKSMLLSSTPWVSEALTDTERMQRLVLLFDGKVTTRVKREAIAKLSKCFIDGGWCWTEQYPHSSQWVSLSILEELGQLNRMGYLPLDSKLRSMIKSAIESVDRQEVADFARYPKIDRWLYVAIRDQFPEQKLSTAASRVVEAQVQRCLADWKTADVPLKAIYASILDKHGYHATARQVLASLREFATESPEKGMWWQQLDRQTTLWSYDRIGITALILDAFNDIEPSSADVEKIRQWLILNKTNNDWGNAVMTTQAVAAILRSGKPLNVNPRGTAIHVGPTLVDPSGAEYATGAFTENISALLSEPQMLTIDRQADYPSVGAVMTMRRLPMDSIPSVECSEISVEKYLSVFDGNQWVDGEQFNVGDKVKVELVLHVEDDLSYVIIEDLRAAGLEPVEQLPSPLYSEGLCFYRENRDSQTNIFIDFLPRGVYRLTYDLYAAQAGGFSSGAAKVQSQYNPIVAAHSGGATIEINRKK